MKNTKKARAERSDEAALAIPEGQPEWRMMTSAELEDVSHPREWLVKSILLADKPMVIAGPPKSMKTSIAVDLALSLGSGKKFLRHFKVPEAVRVALFLGTDVEGPVQDDTGCFADLKEIADRVATAMKVDLSETDVLWSPALPRFGRKGDLARLHSFLKENDVKVVIIDRVHLALFGEFHGDSTSRAFEIGPRLRDAAHACLTAGATPVFVDPPRGNSVSFNRPWMLSEMACRGVAEFARQWVLINRRGSFKAGSVDHPLFLVAEGSDGHSGLWHIDLHEGAGEDAPHERNWNVTVSLPAAKKPTKPKAVKESSSWDFDEMAGL